MITTSVTSTAVPSSSNDPALDNYPVASQKNGNQTKRPKKKSKRQQYAAKASSQANSRGKMEWPGLFFLGGLRFIFPIGDNISGFQRNPDRGM
jgi:hypothetical protein